MQAFWQTNSNYLGWLISATTGHFPVSKSQDHVLDLDILVGLLKHHVFGLCWENATGSTADSQGFSEKRYPVWLTLK